MSITIYGYSQGFFLDLLLLPIFFRSSSVNPMADASFSACGNVGCWPRFTIVYRYWREHPARRAISAADRFLLSITFFSSACSVVMVMMVINRTSKVNQDLPS